MLTNLEIQNFRGFKSLKLSPLKRVNLIVGQNNTGKTGMLEALVLLLNPPNNCTNLPSLFRSAGGDHNESFWRWLFHNKDTAQPATIKTTFKDGTTLEVLLQVNTPAPSKRTPMLKTLGGLGPIQVYGTSASSAGFKVHVFSTHPTDPNEDAIGYNRVVLRRKKKDVEGLLQQIEPRLQAIETLQTGRAPLLYADIGLREMIPVTQMGQGFSRLLDIYSEIVAAEAKVLLIDEVENGIHHSALTTIWRGLLNAARGMDVQVFATTHSDECIQAAHKVFSEDTDYELGIVQLFRQPEGIQGRVLDRKHVEAGIQANIDLR